MTTLRGGGRLIKVRLLPLHHRYGTLAPEGTRLWLSPQIVARQPTTTSTPSPITITSRYEIRSSTCLVVANTTWKANPFPREQRQRPRCDIMLRTLEPRIRGFNTGPSSCHTLRCWSPHQCVLYLDVAHPLGKTSRSSCGTSQGWPFTLGHAALKPRAS